jgi:hypothetical protein
MWWGIIVCKLINRDDVSFIKEFHELEELRHHNIHGMDIIIPKEDIVSH